MKSVHSKPHHRVAIIGSGPAGFYVAEHLLRRNESDVQIDIFERLPCPFGLVRFGVAPDHQKIKSVIRVFDRVASHANVRFFGNVDIGQDISMEDLRPHYHQICVATGAQSDRRMGIPGEDLPRSHPATEFVAWYNGHPDFRDRQFDLSVDRVAVVGVGNVAVDVARILCRTPDELATTDIADHALEALQSSRVKEVYVLGRRGPAQAAFTNAEIKELGEMAGADIVVRPDEAEVDALSEGEVEKSGDAALERKLEILRQFSQATPRGKPRKLVLRFLVSPVELSAGNDGGVQGMRLVKNTLYRSDDGTLRPRPSEVFEDLSVGMVFRSVGYHGTPLAGLPFDARRGVIPNEQGRVVWPDLDAGKGRAEGLYVSGWIKRGPTGVIGTNKPDAGETVDVMLADFLRGAAPQPQHPADSVEEFVRVRQPDVVSYADWKRLDEQEVARGRAQGRPRVKYTSVEHMLSTLQQDRS